MTGKIAILTKKLIADGIQKHRREIWEWQFEKMKNCPPPFYCSIDLRDAGYKIAPVDSNLFPAGFNNICPDDIRTAPSVLRAQVDAMVQKFGGKRPERILIIPESHTSNKYYIENLYYLNQILLEAGFEVGIGWYGPLPEGVTDDKIVLRSATDKELIARPLRIENGQASIQGPGGGFVPDLLLLNNDFSSGYPKILDDVKQPVLPSHRLGWHSRKKSTHFKYYNQLAEEFAKIIQIDPWIIQIDTEEVAGVNFNEGQGIENAALAVERVLSRTQKAYDQHQVIHKPFAFVKNNSGTYGMGIMVVHDANELRTMNRRTKNKMSVGKNKRVIESVAVQEGVPTATLVDRLAAEPVIYLAGGEVIGGFLRTNTEKGIEDNLNSQGMVFRKLCMSDLKRPTLMGVDEAMDPETSDEGEPLLELVYGSIARISAMATGMELSAL